MDSFNVIPIDNVPPETQRLLNAVPLIPDTEKPMVWRCIKMGQVLNDIWQLYQMFCWNYERFDEGLIRYPDDGVLSAVAVRGGDESFDRLWADVNCYATNLMSSGKSLTELLRKFMKEDVGKGEQGAQQFELYTNELYDRQGVYAFMANLRDEAQHAQAPISVFMGDKGLYRAAFDLDQIALPEHFNVKGMFKQILVAKIAEMDNLGGNHHRLSYFQCMDRYHVEVLEVTAEFYSCSLRYIQNTYRQFAAFIKRNPKYLCTLQDGSRCVSILEGKELHSLLGIEKPLDQTHRERYQLIEKRLKSTEMIYEHRWPSTLQHNSAAINPNE